MNKQCSLKELTDYLITTRGNVKGFFFQSHQAFIISRQGKEGIKTIEKKMEKLGQPFNFQKVKSFSWYPYYLNVLTIILAKQVFNWSEKEIWEMGKTVPAFSPTRLLLDQSSENSFNNFSRFWQRAIDFGDLEKTEFNEKEKNLVLRAKWHNFHPLVCVWLAGCIHGLGSLAGLKIIEAKETKCVFKEDAFHEYLIKWQ